MSRSLVILVFAAGGLVFGGCGRPAVRQAGGQPAQVRVGFFANLTHAQAIMAVDSGELASALAPAKLVTRVFNAGPSEIEALLAGEIDIGYIGPGPAINGYVRTGGRGIRIIAGASANGVLIVARKDAGISSPADLRGKRLATPQFGNTQDISARRYLLAVLKQEGTGNIVPVPNAELRGMMLRKQIDAAWAPEPWGTLLVLDPEVQAVPLAREHELKELWPDGTMTLAVVITTPRFLESHPGAVAKFLEVHRNWTRRLGVERDKHLPRLGKALADLTGRALPDEVLRSALGNVRFTDDPLPRTLENMALWAWELGFLRSRPDLTGLVVRTGEAG